jgi:hypothetical protein
MFLDERGTGLRVTWHPERDLVVLSVWQGDGCVGTFRMSVQDIPRLSGLLAAALGDWVDQSGGTPSPGGPRRSGGPGSGEPRPVPGGPAPGGVGSVVGTSGAQSTRITGEWDIGTPVAGGSSRTEGGPGAGLSVQKRIRLSRTVLKLRGMQDRRRRSG